MNYTAKQIENAKRNYNAMLTIHTIANYDVNTIGIDEASKRMDYHNSIVTSIMSGNTAIASEWKLFFLNEEVKSDNKQDASKAKLNANKEASSYILAPVKDLKKIGEFGKWLNTAGNVYRSQNFNKKYTSDAVNAFLATL